MKYVAFLDILGFKETLKKMKQPEAAEYISRFSSIAFDEWTKTQPTLLEGYMHYAMVKQQNVKLAHRKYIG